MIYGLRTELQAPVVLLDAGIEKTYSGPKVLKSYSTQLSMKFQLLIKSKMLKNKHCILLLDSVAVNIQLINVKMPSIIVDIFTFMSK